MADTPLGEVIERLGEESPAGDLQWISGGVDRVLNPGERSDALPLLRAKIEFWTEVWPAILAALQAGQEYVDARKARVRGGSTDVYVSRPMAVHTYECPEPKYGKKSGPCDCGGSALDEAIKGAEAALLAAYGKE